MFYTFVYRWSGFKSNIFEECDRLSNFLTRDRDERIHLGKQKFFILKTN